jgi:hypothetical protein
MGKQCSAVNKSGKAAGSRCASAALMQYGFQVCGKHKSQYDESQEEHKGSEDEESDGDNGDDGDLEHVFGFENGKFKEVQNKELNDIKKINNLNPKKHDDDSLPDLEHVDDDSDDSTIHLPDLEDDDDDESLSDLEYVGNGDDEDSDDDEQETPRCKAALGSGPDAGSRCRHDALPKYGNQVCGVHKQRADYFINGGAMGGFEPFNQHSGSAHTVLVAREVTKQVLAQEETKVFVAQEVTKQVLATTQTKVLLAQEKTKQLLLKLSMKQFECHGH